jgi:hypothetical protein
MGGYFDELMLQQQDKATQQQAAREARLYNPDGSAKANDYRPPALPTSAFPSVEPRGGGELIVHRDRLMAVARGMHQDLVDLQAALAKLNSAGAGGMLVGGWQTADAFGNNAGNAYAGISQFYQDLNAAYETVIASLRQTVSNYEDAESATVSAIRGVSADSPAAPAGSFTRSA